MEPEEVCCFHQYTTCRYDRAVVGKTYLNGSRLKNGSVHTSVLTFDKVNDGETEEKENTSHPDCSKDITLSLLLQALCPVQIANRPAASYAHISYAHIIKDNISEIAEGLSYKLKAFRDFRLYKYPNT